MTRSAIALCLSLSLAIAPVAARGKDAGIDWQAVRADIAAAAGQAPDAGTAPPGRAVELAEGQAAPYAGSLVDRERMGAIYAKRIAAELERDAVRLEVQDARARQAAAESERDRAKASKGPSWGTLFGVAGSALVLGVAGGIAAVLLIQDRAK